MCCGVGGVLGIHGYVIYAGEFLITVLCAVYKALGVIIHKFSHVVSMYRQTAGIIIFKPYTSLSLCLHQLWGM